MNTTDYRPLFPTGQVFADAVKFWKSRNQVIRELEKARRALYRSGVDASLASAVTLEMRRELHELEAMKADGRYQEVA